MDEKGISHVQDQLLIVKRQWLGSLQHRFNFLAYRSDVKLHTERACCITVSRALIHKFRKNFIVKMLTP